MAMINRKENFKNIEVEKLINKIIMFLICVTLFIINILIGPSTNHNDSMINIIVTFVAMIFIITKKISQKEKILENILDIFVLILCISSCIPLIFNTYTTLTGCINYMMKYVSVFWIYIIVKDLVKENSKLKTYIIHIIMISAVLLVIFGIDKMSTNIVFPFAKAINIPQITYEETRMDSFFSYANAFAVFCSMALFLTIGAYIKNEKTIKRYIYGVAIFLLETGIILSYSRMIFIFLSIVFLIYLILLKSKEFRIKTLECTMITGIFAVIYTNVYMNLLSSGNTILLWILLWIFSVLASFITVVAEKLNRKLMKIKIQHIILLIILVTIIAIVVIIIGLQQTEPLVMFYTSTSEKKITKEIYQVRGNTNYTFTFDIEAKSNYKNTDIFQITILEKNKYFDDINQTNLTFGTYSGKKEISITTEENTTEIFIIFTSQIVKEDMYLKINQLLINDNEEVLNYKYLSTSLVSKIKNINLNTKSAWERGIFVKDALKLIKDNFLFGIGGDGWQYREGEVQSYYYWAREVHSYPIQVLLEFGIVGFLALIGIVILVIKYSYLYLKKKIDVEYITILCSMLIVFLHSFLDFDMSYMCIMIMMFVLLGIVNAMVVPRNCNKKKTKNIINILIFIAFIPILGINGLNHFIYSQMQEVESENNADIAYEKLQNIIKSPTYLVSVKEEKIRLTQIYTKIYKIDKNAEIIEDLEWMLRHEKYNNTLENCKQLIETYGEMNHITEEEYIEKVEEICNIAKDTKIQELYNVTKNLERQIVFLDIADILNQTYEKMQNEKILAIANVMLQKVIDEYNDVLERISDYEKCRVTKEEAEKVMEILEENYEKAKSMVK